MAPVLEVKVSPSPAAGADRLNAVENVSFSSRRGNRLRGRESGSGKSVTSHAIMGLLPPNQLSVAAGRVLLEGTICWRNRRRRCAASAATASDDLSEP